MSNILIRAAHGLTLVEKRILMAALGQMSGIFKEVKISAQEYADTYDMPVKQAYEQLKYSAQNFRKRYLSFAEQDRKTIINWEINWLSYISYADNMGYVIIKFNPDLMPHLCELQGQFTKYQLRQTCALRSIYSWRLLELFEQMRNKKDGNTSRDGWLHVTIEDFWHAMDVTVTHRKNFNQTRVKVIEPAIRELQEKDGWLIEWDPIKEGRRVAHLRFRFDKNPQGRLAI